jgi:glycosyltransferase involved in cell wall biosynthesis
MDEIRNTAINILLATYNGENYIKRQIESLLSQTYSNWHLWVRDDCSSDVTLAIIKQFADNDDRISIIDNQNLRLGACQNFSRLMEICPKNSSYIMFCDQDDIWLPEKIEKSLKAMQLLEKEYNCEKNLLVYGTYKMIDENDTILELPIPNYSMTPKLNVLLTQNYVYGCTTMINDVLLKNSLSIASTAENHDYWITLTAIANDARFKYIEEPLILYRQHSKNVTGSYKNAFFANRIRRLFYNKEINSIKKRLAMFVSFIDRNENKMTTENKKMLNGFISSSKKGRSYVFTYCLVNKIYRLGKLQTFMFYFNLLRCKIAK